MLKSVQRLFMMVAIIGAIALTAILVNQFVQLSRFCFDLYPPLGYASVVLFALLGFFLIGYPLWQLSRMPRVLRPPEDENSPEYREFLRLYGRRLARNPNLDTTGLNLERREDIEKAIAQLDLVANKQIKDAASVIFISTAISQNGRLDALLVLVGQFRLIWRLAHIYQERPSWRELLSLYNTVLVTALLASQLEDIDVAEHIEPVMRTVLGGSVAGMVPGATAITTVLVGSVMEGTANAFLTLRVGVICRRACSALRPVERRVLARTGVTEAAAMLSEIVISSTKVVSSAIARAVRKSGTDTVSQMGSKLTGGAKDLFNAGRTIWGKQPQTD